MVVYKYWGGFTVVVVIKIGPWEFRTKNKLIIFINELVRRYNDNRIAYTSGSMAYFFYAVAVSVYHVSKRAHRACELGQYDARRTDFRRFFPRRLSICS